MIVADITELGMMGVLDRGKPNQERMIFYVNEALNIGRYGVMVGIRAADNTAFPVKDNLFWFGDGLFHAGDWIFLYTGPGEPRFAPVPNANPPQRIFSLHWGRATTVFNHPNLTPILFRVDGVHLPEEFLAISQGQTTPSK